MAVPARINLVPLAVADLDRSRAFYGGLGWQPAGPKGAGAEEVAFYDLNGVVFALYRRDYLLRDLGITAGPRMSPPKTTLAINVETEAEVAATLAEAEAAGGAILAPATRMDWGGTAGYFADPDGHAWEVAHNPMMPLGPDGRMQLP